MTIAILFWAAIIGYVLWLFFKGTYKGYTGKEVVKAEADRPSTPSPKPKKTYTLNADRGKLIEMPEPTTRLLSYDDERRAARNRQRLWMQYQDKSGNITERTVEIYQPEKDEVLFTWCCLKREPRTFARRNILQWRLLPERFDYDPVVARYWDEEAGLDLSEKMPWRRWLQQQPDDIASRYL